MKLKELRLKKELTQEELAKKLDITRFTYGNYELEKTQPDIELLKQIADYYEVTLDYLCEHETKNKLELGYLTNEQKNAIKLLITLTQFQLARTTSFMLGIKATEN